MIMIIINAILLSLNVAICVAADKVSPLNLAAIVGLSFTIGMIVDEKLWE